MTEGNPPGSSDMSEVSERWRRFDEFDSSAAGDVDRTGRALKHIMAVY